MKLKSFITIILSLALFFSLNLTALADVEIDKIEVIKIQNSSATVKWHTSHSVRGTIFYGLKIDELNQVMDSAQYEYDHETTLNNIKKDNKYFFKIVAIDVDGNRTEAFTQTFETWGMTEVSQIPTIVSKQVLQTSYDAVGIAWTTDIPSRATISLSSLDDPNRLASYGAYDTIHYLYIYSLKPEQKYNVVITAESKSGDKVSAGFSFNTSQALGTWPKLSISNYQPLSPNSQMIAGNHASVSWETNLVARSYIYYGTAPGAYHKMITVNTVPSYKHQVYLEGLEPQTTYYYKIIVNDSLYGQSAQSLEKSFTTQWSPQVLSEKILTDATNSGSTAAKYTVDSDNDGLSDSQELAYGTDRLNADTDSDGYNDALEIKNNFNPRGYGRTLAQMEKALANKKSVEAKKAGQLVSWLPYQKTLPSNWTALVNAYVFGGYPVETIRQAVKYDSHIVNTTVPWRIWQSSDDYLYRIKITNTTS